jgi:hypothetical protein
MKCIFGLLLVILAAFYVQAYPSPARNAMVYYQTQPYGYYGNPMAHRAFLMQYASQPLKRQASGVTAYASGKKIAAKTYLKRKVLTNKDFNFINP